MLPNVMVSRDGDHWAVRRENTEPVLNRVGSLQEALEIGRQVARQGGVDLIWEDEDGQSQRESFAKESGASTRGAVSAPGGRPVTPGG